MAKIEKLKKDVAGVSTTIYPVTIPQGVIDPATGETLPQVLEKKADLVGGKVPANQLPSFVDDVIEVNDFSSLPAVGESGKIYVTKDNNMSYRYTGTSYVKISNPVDFASQAEAEGNEENTKAVTSLRVFQNFVKNSATNIFTALKTQAKTLVGGINELSDSVDTKAAHGYESNPKTLKQVDDSLLQLAGEVSQKIDSSMIPDIFATNDSPIESYTVTRSFTGGSFNNYETGQYQTINANDVTINIPVAGSTSVLHYFPTGRSIENGKTYTVVYAQLSSLSAIMPSITAIKEGVYTTIGYSSSGVPRKIVRQSGVAGTQTDLSGVIRAIATGDEVKITYRDGVSSIFLNGENIWNHSEVLDGEFAISIGGFGSTDYQYSIVSDYIGDFVRSEIEKIEKVYPESLYSYSQSDQAFYVYSHISEDRYGRAKIVRNTNEEAYLDYWRLERIDGYTYNVETGEFISDGAMLLSIGENECVWRRSALSDDFTGGFHGDEKYQRLQILVDGVAIEIPTADIALTKCNSFRYIIHSEMYKTAQSGVTDHAIECYHVKVTDIGNGGYKTFNRLTWAVGGSLSLWYAGISCVGKVCATQVATDYDFVPIPYTGAEGAVPEFTGFREMHAYNATSKYSAKVTSKIIKPSAQDATAVMFIADRGVDSKYYRRLSGYNPVVGEVWESEMIVSYGVMG